MYKDRDWLYKKYIEEGLTCKEIAVLCNCHGRTIHQRLVVFAIPRRKRGVEHLNKERKERLRQWHKAHPGHHPPIMKWNPLDRLLMSIQRRGERGASWKGGISVLNIAKRQSLEYKNWRQQVYVRDNFTCQICGARKVYLIAHHIKSFSEYPDLIFEHTNGITLCRDCHFVTHNFHKGHPFRGNKYVTAQGSKKSKQQTETAQ